jgi:hypothetical protein
MAKRGKKPSSPEYREALITSRFNDIKSLMEKGYPRYLACKKLGFDSKWFYKNLSYKQKRILDEIYSLHSYVSSGTKWRMERCWVNINYYKKF